MNAILENSDVISKMRGKWHEIIIEKSKIFTIVSLSSSLSFKAARSKEIFLGRFKKNKR